MMHGHEKSDSVIVAAKPANKAVGLTTADSLPKLPEAFRAGLRDLGYQEGRDIIIEFRWAEGHYERLPALFADLVRLESARDCEAVAGREGSCEAGELSNDVGCPLHAVRCCSLGLKDSLYCEIAHIWERRCLRRAQTPPDPFDGPGGGGRALKRSRPVRGFRTGTKSSSACPEAIPPVRCRRWPTRAAEMPMRLAVG
jgi:hypothetical protein